jgi:hypothetical protein
MAHGCVDFSLLLLLLLLLVLLLLLLLLLLVLLLLLLFPCFCVPDFLLLLPRLMYASNVCV